MIQITTDTLIVFRKRTMRFETLADEVLPDLMGPLAIVFVGRALESRERVRIGDVCVRLAKPSEIDRFNAAGAA